MGARAAAGCGAERSHQLVREEVEQRREVHRPLHRVVRDGPVLVKGGDDRVALPAVGDPGGGLGAEADELVDVFEGESSSFLDLLFLCFFFFFSFLLDSFHSSSV